MKTIEWATTNGTRVEITIATDFHLNSQGDRKTSGAKEVTIAAKVNGKPHQIIGGIRPIKNHPVCVAQLGQIGLTQENHTAVQTEIAAAAAEIAEHNAALEQHGKDLDNLGNGDINTLIKNNS